jgi:hypothetical protein
MELVWSNSNTLNTTCIVEDAYPEPKIAFFLIENQQNDLVERFR